MKKNSKVERINGHLHRITPVVDDTGNVINHIIRPLMVETRPRDILQILIGSAMIAVPLAFTEETWELGTELPIRNIVLLTLIGLSVVSFFVFFNFYRYEIKGNWHHFAFRVLAIIVLSHLTVALLLTVINRAPWQTDTIVAFKRVMLISFPAQMAASITDILK